MDTERQFNLVDDAWIPVVACGRVSLREAFARPDLTALGGTPLEKIALFKLLQAVAQAARTPACPIWRHGGTPSGCTGPRRSCNFPPSGKQSCCPTGA